MKIKKLFITLTLVAVLAASSMAMFGCALFGGNTLADGVYHVDRVYINGTEIDSNHTHWITLTAMHFEVSGSNLGIFLLGSRLITVEHRITSGYIEQRSPQMHNNQWIRENGSAASGHNSLRAESREIVMRHGMLSEVGRLVNGSVSVFFSLNATAPETTPPPETGTGVAPTQEQLLGKWYLNTQWTSGIFGTSRPGDALWVGGYFIEFNEDGTFSEVNFWNHLNTVSGTWTLSGSTLTLTRLTGSDGGLTFIGTRTLEINAEGSELIMIYSRPNPPADAWEYINVFSRYAPDANGNFM